MCGNEELGIGNSRKNLLCTKNLSSNRVFKGVLFIKNILKSIS
jgi:hypothetical protein